MSVDPGGSGTPMSERMQSLLSRAVEDQLSEQRQLAGLIAELRNQLARMAEELHAVRAATAANDPGSAGAAAGVVAEVREGVRLLAERVDGVARLVQERGADLAEVKALVGEIRGAVQTQSEALGGVSGGLAALPAFGERIGGLQGNLGALHERLAAVDEMAGAVGALQQHVDGVGQDLRELRSAFTGIASRVAEVPGRADLSALAAQLAERVDELGARLGRVEAAFPRLQARLDEAPGPSAGIDEGALAGLRAELARFADGVTAEAERSGERLQRLDARLEELSEQLDQLEVVPEGAEGAVEEEDGSEPGEDPVLVELSELREALLGPDGLGDKLDALGDVDLDARVSSAVAEAVASVESRLTAHMDEAVLALAEALLRRRGSRPGQPPSAAAATADPAATPASGVPAPAASDEEVGEDEEDQADLADQDPGAGEDLGAAEEDLEDEDLGEATEAAAAQPADPRSQPADPRWQTPPETTPAETTPQVLPPAEPGRRRRPWWRPGD